MSSTMSSHVDLRGLSEAAPSVLHRSTRGLSDAASSVCVVCCCCARLTRCALPCVCGVCAWPHAGPSTGIRSRPRPTRSSEGSRRIRRTCRPPTPSKPSPAPSTHAHLNCTLTLSPTRSTAARGTSALCATQTERCCVTALASFPHPLKSMRLAATRIGVESECSRVE
eukprot:5132911-Prymnesium_polylepis.2